MSDTTYSDTDSIHAEVVDEDFDPNTGEVAGAEVTVYSDPVVDSAIASLNTGTGLAYSSVVGDDFDTKLRVLNAVTNSEPVKRNIDKVFNLKDIVVQKVALKDTRPGAGPGDRIVQPRIILLDTEGNAYHAISPVLLGSVGNFIGILGEPKNWPEGGVPTRIKANKAAVGEFYTIEPVAVKVAKK